jgi:hypothetical protein
MQSIVGLGAPPNEPTGRLDWAMRAIAEIVRASHRPNPNLGLLAAPSQSISARLMHTGGIISASGGDATPVVTETYICEVYVPANASINGVAILNGTAVAGKIVVGLADSSGDVLANSALAGTNLSGTNAYQRVAFTAAYAAKGPATYYVLAQFNNTSARFAVHLLGNFGASKKTGETFGTLTAITPPTTFTEGLGPIASLY